MSVLLDTNVLLRRTQPDHPSHAVAVESVARLLAAGEPVYLALLQNVVEGARRRLLIVGLAGQAASS
jgi:predicted nucleic acid-binding protein